MEMSAWQACVEFKILKTKKTPTLTGGRAPRPFSPLFRDVKSVVHSPGMARAQLFRNVVKPVLKFEESGSILTAVL